MEPRLQDVDPTGLQESNRFTDEELVNCAQRGDLNAMEKLLERYKNLVKHKARTYFLIGADHDDIMQEGMIGLYKAVRDFRPEKQATFYAFAELCVTRQIITAIKSATRQKHIPLNSYVSLNKPVFDENSERTLEEVMTSGSEGNPEAFLIDREELQDMETAMNQIMSDMERDVVNAYLEGKSYQEISVEVGKSQKAVDNALQRVKRKLAVYLKGRI